MDWEKPVALCTVGLENDVLVRVTAIYFNISHAWEWYQCAYTWQ